MQVEHATRLNLASATGAQLREHFAYFARWAIVGLAFAFVLVWFRPDLLTSRVPAPPTTSYATAVATAGPSVVNIYATGIVTETPVARLSDQASRMLGQSFTPIGPPTQRLEQSLGSAVIVRGDGYLLTNNHVVANKDNIRVVLWDGRTTDARIVATDPDTDLAVLKIDVEALPALAFAADGALAIGDVVLAIGNPFGLGQSVTMGIVSARGESAVNLGLMGYEHLIQTDAAVNTGNSGGALINAQGELVGINTAMFGRGRGAEGISFAIPIETARHVLDSIIRQGFVQRGWLGVDLVPVQLSNSLSGEQRVALRVILVEPNSPADRAGIRPGDALMRMHGVDVQSLNHFRSFEANLAPDTEVTIDLVRAGLGMNLNATLMQKPNKR
jgi:S1-C subfamily serine protease